MNDFWTRHLNGGRSPQPPAPAPQQHAPANSRPWWDQSTPVEVQSGYGTPAQAQVLYDAADNAVMVANGQVMATQVNANDLPPDIIECQTKSARLARGNSNNHCPACDSPDYSSIGTIFTKNGQVETMRCFACGYPVEQRFSGMKGLTTGGKVEGKTRQVEHGGIVPNFSGQQIQPPAFAAEQGGPGR